jgi:NAD(P)-dependent dehydrogenase (short-subunit alcohol dehydrogenase family)
MEHLVVTWALEVASSKLRVNLFDPDIVDTKMRAAAFPGENRAALRRPEEVAELLVPLCLPAETRHGEMVVVPPKAA